MRMEATDERQAPRAAQSRRGRTDSHTRPSVRIFPAELATVEADQAWAPGPPGLPRPASTPRRRVAAAGVAGRQSAPAATGSTATATLRLPLAARLQAWRRPGAPDYALALGVAVLLLLGLVMVFSASQFVRPDDPSYWFRHQLVWALIGLAALLITSRVDYRVWRRFARVGMLVALVLLGAVLVFGREAYGAQRWLHLGFFSIQPSELAKLALAVYLADWMARLGEGVRTLRRGLVPFLVVAGTVVGLVLLQNDMGTSLVVAALALAMFFAAGAGAAYIAPTLGLSGLAYWVLVTATPFRRGRLEAFLHPLPPGCDGAWQVCQGLLSLGSGGVFGRGLGDSVQKAGYLPNPFTDSIFAIVGEELGLLGCALLLGLFAFLALRGLRIARRAPDTYATLLACGITCWLVAQAAINVGSTVDVIPFTGVPLPFVSFGGSSLVTSLAAVGVLLNISRHSRQVDSL